jgi:hypothetical protein
MDSLILGFGFFVVAAGFLLNVPLVAALYYFVTKPLFKAYKGGTKGALFGSLVILVVVVTLSYLPGSMKFDELCRAHGEPLIGKLAAADKYFVDAYYVWIHDKTEELLKSGRLAFVEGRSNRSRDLPYKRVLFDENGTRVEHQVASLESEYGLRMRHGEQFGVTSTTREFYRIDDDEVVSSYTTHDYMGGPLAWLVQPWGRRSCPEFGDRWYGLTYKELPLITFGLDTVD